MTAAMVLHRKTIRKKHCKAVKANRFDITTGHVSLCGRTVYLIFYIIFPLLKQISAKTDMIYQNRALPLPHIASN